MTNAEFKAFVDAGGYEKRDYWSEPFVRNGQPLDWAAAMAIFRDRDRTARTGDLAGRRAAGRPGATTR